MYVSKEVEGVGVMGVGPGVAGMHVESVQVSRVWRRNRLTNCSFVAGSQIIIMFVAQPECSCPPLPLCS